MTEWYYSDAERQQHGPVDAGSLAALHNKGLLTADMLVWREGMSAWKPWGEMIREVIAGGAPEDPRAEAMARAAEAAPNDGAYRPYAIAEPSPYTPPQAQLEAQGSVVLDGHVVYAGFWKRVAASIIDNFLLGIVGGIIGAILGVAIGLGSGLEDNPAADLLINLFSIVLGAFYFGWMHSSEHQASLGKMAVGIKVVRTSGERISFARGIGRHFATILSAIILGIGYLMAAFTGRKQALHDIVCDTLVVDKHAFTEHPEWQNEELGTVTIVILALSALLFVGVFLMAMIAGAALMGGMR
ncbi:MAG: RDD family protein [Xanthomonadaceae bacterium]|nr:RDD family protein [Xanthomonadaceae bacterium]